MAATAATAAAVFYIFYIVLYHLLAIDGDPLNFLDIVPEFATIPSVLSPNKAPSLIDCTLPKTMGIHGI